MNLFGRVTRTELYEVQQALNLLSSELKVLQGKQVGERAMRSQLLRRVKVLEELLNSQYSEEYAAEEDPDSDGLDTTKSKGVEEARLRLGRGE